MRFNLEKLREQFPMLKQTMNGNPLIYLDNAATTFKPRCVIDTITRFYESEYSTIHRSIYEFSAVASERYSGVRRKIADFLHLKDEQELIFTRGATESLNIVAQCYGRSFLHEGDEIVISEMEHHANIVPWQMVAEEKGCIIKVIPMDDEGNLSLEALKKILSPRTKIVSVCHASNSVGTINPIQQITKMAHDVGAICVVDGAQAAPHITVDLQELGCDFYAFSGHKIFGPTGIGILYGKKPLLEAMRPYHGGGDMVREVTFAKTTYQDPPMKFEAGTPMIAQVLGLGAAIDFFTSLDRPAMEEHERSLAQIIIQQLENFPGITILGRAQNRLPLVTFIHDKIHPLDLGTMMALKGVAIRTGTLCAQPALSHFRQRSACRVSIAPYNTEEEIHSFMNALSELCPLLVK